MYIQHGDVLLKKIDSLPKGLKKEGTNILAYGEATGHTHSLHGGIFNHLVNKKERFLEVVETASLQHQEHNEIEIDPGIYKIHIVREYDHFEEEAREVAD